MTATGLEVRLHQGRERAEVTRFTRTLDEVVRSLREIDQVYLLRGSRATWVLADLTHSGGDLVVRLQARPGSLDRPSGDLLVPVQALVDGAEVLARQPTVPELFAPATVARLGKLAQARDGVQTVSLSTYNGTAGQPVDLNDAVKVNADTAVRPFGQAHGSLSGVVFGIRDTRRTGNLRVTVLNDVGRQAVEGHVPEALAESVRRFWRHRVVVSGVIRRNVRGQAIRIDVERIEDMPENDAQRPSTDDLLGVAADWLEGLTVDQFIDQVRRDG